MRLGVELVPYISLDRMVEIAKLVEELGYHQLWVCDHYHNRSVFIALSQIALATSRIQLGPGVTNPYLVHPAVTAAAVATLQELSKGRAALGISAGDPFFLLTLGVRHHKPITAVREAVEIARGLWSGEPFDFKGALFTCHRAKLRFTPPDRIPVYVGGRRPRILQLAARIGDGVLINASHPHDLHDARVQIRGSTSSPEFDTVAYLAVSVGSDLDRARRMVRGIVAFIAASAPDDSLEYHGISPDDVEEVRKWLRSGEIQKAREAVSPRMIEAFSVCGSFSDLESRLEEVRKLGFSTAVIGSPIGPDPKAVLERASLLSA